MAKLFSKSSFFFLYHTISSFTNTIPSCTSAGSVLQMCKFHKNPISGLGGVALTSKI
jgi:hypothetical protein